MHVRTHSSCVHACMCVWCVFRCVCACIYAHTLPCEICQWCRSSSMINSPACWKQCYSALATCGTPINCMCVSAFVCETAWISTLRSCSRCVDVVSLLLVHKSATCQNSCVLCNPTQLCVSDRTDKLLGKPKSIKALLCCAYRLWHQWALRVKWFGMVRQ